MSNFMLVFGGHFEGMLGVCWSRFGSLDARLLVSSFVSGCRCWYLLASVRVFVLSRRVLAAVVSRKPFEIAVFCCHGYRKTCMGTLSHLACCHIRNLSSLSHV